MGYGPSIGTLGVIVTGDITNLKTALRAGAFEALRFSQSVNKSAKSAESSMGSLAGATMLVGGAIAALTVQSVRSFAKMEQSFADATAFMVDSSKEAKSRLVDLAKTMSTQSITSADDLAKAMYRLAISGIDAEKQLAVLPIAQKFAIASNTDLEESTRALIDAQYSMGLVSNDTAQNQRNLARVSNVLVRANTLANTSATELAIALSRRAGPAFRGLGISIEDGVAILNAYAKAGIRGSMAGRQAEIMLRELQKSAIKASSTWRQFGLSVYDNNGKLRDVAQVLSELGNRMSEVSDEERKFMLMQLGFSQRSEFAIRSIINMSEEIKRSREELKKTGATEKIVTERTTTLEAEFTKLWNTLKLSNASFGEGLSVVLNMRDGVVSLTEALKDLEKEHLRNAKQKNTNPIEFIMGGGAWGNIKESWKGRIPMFGTGEKEINKRFNNKFTNRVRMENQSEALIFGSSNKKVREQAFAMSEAYDRIGERLKALSQMPNAPQAEYVKLVKAQLAIEERISKLYFEMPKKNKAQLKINEEKRKFDVFELEMRKYVQDHLDKELTTEEKLVFYENQRKEIAERIVSLMADGKKGTDAWKDAVRELNKVYYENIAPLETQKRQRDERRRQEQERSVKLKQERNILQQFEKDLSMRGKIREFLTDIRTQKNEMTGMNSYDMLIKRMKYLNKRIQASDPGDKRRMYIKEFMSKGRRLLSNDLTDLNRPRFAGAYTAGSQEAYQAKITAMSAAQNSKDSKDMLKTLNNIERKMVQYLQKMVNFAQVENQRQVVEKTRNENQQGVLP